MDIRDTESCYRALAAHDARFDGVFYVGVKTTGIYCRTICPARTPRQDRCTFYPSAAAAEGAGFRPCLRCRPELAPGNARVDAESRLAAVAYGRIEDGALDSDGGVAKLAEELGVSDRHLRRVLQGTFGVSPARIAQTQRLLLAKRLLTDTDLPITEIAFASGFSTIRRFNALFQERYRLNPTTLRKQRSSAPTAETLVCRLAYRPPLDWAAMLGFLQGRAVRGVESVAEGVYRRTAEIDGRRGWFAVSQEPGHHRLKVEVSASLAPVLLRLLARIKRVFDLSADPQAIAERLGALAEARPGLRVPGAFDGYEAAVRAILGQQVSVKSATTLAGRFAQTFGEPIETPFEALNRLTPVAVTVARAETEKLTALGIVGARARSILALSNAVAHEGLTLQPSANPDAVMARLRALPGIGEWTAQYIAMRALGNPDAFPHTDLGLYKALGTTSPKEMLALAEAWRPWRAYAVMHLWLSLEQETKS